MGNSASVFLADMHVHSHNSHDSKAAIIDIAKNAINNNVSVIAITDHCDIQYYEEQKPHSVFRNVAQEIDEASKHFDGKVKILKGIELGEGTWNKGYAKELLDSFAFDVVIASVHAVKYKDYCDTYSTIDFSKMPKNDLYEFMDKYFDALLETVMSIPADIMAHLTCPLRYINGKFGLNIDSKKYEDKICKILEYIIDNDIAMEINTSVDGFMPEEWIIAKFKEMGGSLITLGSDAHVPENVSQRFGAALQLLKKYGFDSYYHYEKRKKVRHEI